VSLLDLKRVSQFALDHELICSAIYQIPDFLAILSTFCGDISVTVTTFAFLSDVVSIFVNGLQAFKGKIYKAVLAIQHLGFDNLNSWDLCITPDAVLP